jgi:hypothetical protein
LAALSLKRGLLCSGGSRAGPVDGWQLRLDVSDNLLALLSSKKVMPAQTSA